MTIDQAIDYFKDVANEAREAAISYEKEKDFETATFCWNHVTESEQILGWLWLAQRVLYCDKQYFD